MSRPRTIDLILDTNSEYGKKIGGNVSREEGLSLSSEKLRSWMESECEEKV